MNIRFNRFVLSFLLFSLLFFSSHNYPAVFAAGLPAFPGAEGFGSQTVGGRGGRIVEVTNLNDSGVGSFRQAVAVERGPRIVVFKIGGIINLKSNIEIYEPFLTVAGQTALGEGIVLVGGRLGVRTHDVIIRGMKVRPGDGPGGDLSSRDGISVTVDPNTKAEVYNVMIDHNSISWGLDENASIWDNTFGVYGVKLHDVTYSWNIISEALRCGVVAADDTGTKNCSTTGQTPYDKRVRSFGFLIGEDTKNISVHHNLMASNDYRNPNITQGVTLEFINNVIYNYGLDSMTVSVGGNNGPENPNFINIIGNYFKPTAGTFKDASIDGTTLKTIKGIRLSCRMANAPASKIYVFGNIDTLYRTNDSQDQWDAVDLPYSCRSELISMKSNTSVLSQTGGVNNTNASMAYSQVLDYSGARAQGVDIVDARAVQTTKEGTSPVAKQIISGPGNRNNWFIDTPAETGINPVYATTQADVLFDTDHDGMPQSWEQAKGGNLDPSGISPSGYTWIEEYINSLIPTGGGEVVSPPPSKSGDANNDNQVNDADYSIWLTNYNKSVSGVTNGDFNNSGKVDGVDYVLWLNNYSK